MEQGIYAPITGNSNSPNRETNPKILPPTSVLSALRWDHPRRGGIAPAAGGIETPLAGIRSLDGGIPVPLCGIDIAQGGIAHALGGICTAYTGIVEVTDGIGLAGNAEPFEIYLCSSRFASNRQGAHPEKFCSLDWLSNVLALKLSK